MSVLRCRSRELQVGIAVFLAVPLLTFLYQLLLLVGALAIRGLFQVEWLQRAVQFVITDPVHAQVTIEAAGGIQPLGLLLSGTPGQFLHHLFPNVFLDPTAISPWAWVSAVVSGDSTVLSLLLTRALVAGIVIALASLLVQWGMQARGPYKLLQVGHTRQLVAVALGLLLMGQAFWDIIEHTLIANGDTLRDAGIGFALSTVWQVSAPEYQLLMNRVLPILILTVTVAAGLGLGRLVGKLRPRHRLSAQRELEMCLDRRSRFLSPALVPSILVVMIALSFMFNNYFGLARLRRLDLTQLQAAPLVGQNIPIDPAPSVDSPSVMDVTPAPSDSASLPDIAPVGLNPFDLSPRVHPTRTPASTLPFMLQPAASGQCANASGSPLKAGTLYTTTIQPLPSLRLLVNGQPATLIGMNYNVNYTILPVQVRRARHLRDFKLLRDAGVNAVIGWGVYDEVTLETAAENGIGVIMPFDLDSQGAYDNLNYREQVKSQFRTFVNRFRTFPAVLAWNPGGDELLHRMEVDQHRSKDKLQAAAAFLLELAQLAHSLDPNHVSVIKDAWDWYLPYFQIPLTTMKAQSNQPDPSTYLVYAVNVYGTPTNIATALAHAHQNLQSLRLAMLVGEYAPFGLVRQDRPTYYGTIWDSVHANSPNGGFVYVFGPDQPNPQSPNPYDPLRLLVNEFSLVDINGTPVDNSLSILTAHWLCRPLMPTNLP